MKPILVYSREEAQRNKFVVKLLQERLDVALVEPDYRGEASYVINRSNDCKIAEFYESRGVRVFNPAPFTRLANNKQSCYDFMEQNGIEILPTRYYAVPFVKKPVDGHGGMGVKMCYSADEYDEKMVCQKPATDLGKDLRVWVVGGKIIASILRSSDTDFRSNYCLGGNAILYNLSENEAELVQKIINLVDADYYGIDFVFNNGEIIFNELEDTVGARMVYDKTDIDILNLYCDYILEKISK